MTNGILLANSDQMVMKYSLNLSAINCLFCVNLPLNKNTWLHENTVLLLMISLITCQAFFQVALVVIKLLLIVIVFCYINKLP